MIQINASFSDLMAAVRFIHEGIADREHMMRTETDYSEAENELTRQEIAAAQRFIAQARRAQVIIHRQILGNLAQTADDTCTAWEERTAVDGHEDETSRADQVNLRRDINEALAAAGMKPGDMNAARTSQENAERIADGKQ